MLTAAQLPVALVLTPLVGAALCLTAPRRAALVAAIAAVLTVGGVATLAWQVAKAGAYSQAPGGWLPPLGIELRASGQAAALMALAGLVMGASMLSAWRSFHSSTLAACWLLAWTALNVVFLSADLFNVYVALELLGIAAVALVIRSDDAGALRAALGYLVAGLFGSLLFLLGVALVYSATGSLSVDAPASVEPQATRVVALALMTAGVLLKAAVFPLHGWLPTAHAAAPAFASAALSGVVVKAGIVLLWRLWAPAVDGAAAQTAAVLLGLCGAGALLWGSLMALSARRLKLIIAYSTVAQLGYLTLAVPLFERSAEQAGAGALLLLTSHALAKAGCFIAAGSVYKRAGGDSIDALSGLHASAPVAVFTLAIGALCLVGLPPSGAFAGKWTLLGLSAGSGDWHWFVALLAGSALSAAVFVRALGGMFLAGTAGGDGGAATSGASATAAERVALALVVAALAMGPLAGHWIALAQITAGGPST